MLLLYGRHYSSRYREIAELIPDRSSVLDVCCGPALLYDRYLKVKAVEYTGLDINAKFVDQLKRRGGHGEVWDLRREVQLPRADCVVMQASLYHFLPDPSPVVNRMLQAAREQVIIAEPIRNITSSNSRLVSSLGRLLTNPGTGEHQQRFDEDSLAIFFSQYTSRITRSVVIAGGREKMYILNGSASQ